MVGPNTCQMSSPNLLSFTLIAFIFVLILFILDISTNDKKQNYIQLSLKTSSLSETAPKHIHYFIPYICLCKEYFAYEWSHAVLEMKKTLIRIKLIFQRGKLH